MAAHPRRRCNLRWAPNRLWPDPCGTAGKALDSHARPELEKQTTAPELVPSERSLSGAAQASAARLRLGRRKTVVHALSPLQHGASKQGEGERGKIGSIVRFFDAGKFFLVRSLPARLLAGHTSSKYGRRTREIAGRVIWKCLFSYGTKTAVYLFSPVAQSVEQLAVNQLVGGSSPSRGARFLNRCLRTSSFSFPEDNAWLFRFYLPL